MTPEEIALGFDHDDMPVEAIWAYEIAIHAADVRLESFLNLAVLYFIMNDVGFASARHLDMRMVDLAYPRAIEVLGAAEVRFGKSAEIDFWRLHMKERVLGETIPAEVYERLSSQGSLSAPVALYVASGKVAYRVEAERVFSAARPADSARKRYLLSFA